MKKNLMLMMMVFVLAMMFATPVKAAGFSGSFDIEDGTFVESVPEVTPVVPEVPEVTPEVAPVVPETTPEVAPVVPETTPEVAPVVPETTPEVAPVVPETTPEVAPVVTPVVTPVVEGVAEEVVEEVLVARVDSVVEAEPVVAKAHKLQGASLSAAIQNTSDEEDFFENTSRVGLPLWGALAVLAVLFLGRYRIVSVCMNEDGEEESANLGNYFLFDSALKEMLNHANSDAAWERLVIVNKFRLPRKRKTLVQECGTDAYTEWMNRSEQRVAQKYMGYLVPYSN